jgi:hypothetical protein
LRRRDKNMQSKRNRKNWKKRLLFKMKNKKLKK